MDAKRDEANKKRFVDQSGLEASDLPDQGRGPIESHEENELSRNLPHQHGGELGGEGGIRGDRRMSDADRQGGRKHN